MSERVEALRLLEEDPATSSDAILAALEDDASEVRAQAASSAIVARDNESRAISNLLDLAGAKEPEERAAALRALGRSGSVRAQAALEQALADPTAAVQLAAVEALTTFVRPGAKILTDRLTPLLTRGDTQLRLACVALLDALALPNDAGELSARSSQLRQAARDTAPEIRAAALQAMGHLRDARLLPDLQSAASDADESVRLWAISALGDTNLPGAVTALRAHAIGAEPRGAQTALAALGRVDDPGALQAIAAQLNRPQLAQPAVDALVTRVRRLRNEATFRDSSEALRRVIETTREQDVLSALARGLVELAPLQLMAAEQHSSLAAAQSSLLRALEELRGDVATLTTSLIELHDPGLFAALLTRAEHETPAALPSLLDALLATLRASRDTAALLTSHAARLTKVLEQPRLPPVAAASLLQLRSLVGLDTTADERDPASRRILAQLWAELPALPKPDAAKRNQKLLSWLDDGDGQVRERSSVALARSAGAAELSVLSSRLEQHAPYPLLTLQACAGALLRTAATLPAPVRERLLQQLKLYLEQPDEELAMSALFALRSSADVRAARWIAGLLRGSSLALRGAALQALGDFDEQDARRLLRDTLRGDNIQSASSAALALAELGSDHDVDALLRAAERGSWPLQPTAAYAAARITQRAHTRKHSLERVLCRFAQQRDSYVLANSASALAALAADACDDQTTPSAFLNAALPSALRVAGAKWLRSINPRSARLASCAEDHDVAVARACAPHPETAEGSGRTLVHVFEPDGYTPLRERTVALRLPNASVYIGRSDNTGLLLLPRAVQGEIVLEDPADHAAVVLPQHAAPENP